MVTENFTALVEEAQSAIEQGANEWNSSHGEEIENRLFGVALEKEFKLTEISKEDFVNAVLKSLETFVSEIFDKALEAEKDSEE